MTPMSTPGQEGVGIPSVVETLARRERLGMGNAHRSTAGLRSLLEARAKARARRQQIDAEDAVLMEAERRARALVPVELTPLPETMPLWRRIVIEVARKHGLTFVQLAGQQRFRKIVAARHECFWRLHNETTMSLPAIGRRLNRDHTTVLHGIKQHEKRGGFSTLSPQITTWGCAENPPLQEGHAGLESGATTKPDLLSEAPPSPEIGSALQGGSSISHER